MVTGAGKGIGREIAVLLSKLGARVVAVSRTRADLDSLKREIGCETISVDLGDARGARDAAERAGEIDLLVNNAGISRPQSLLDTTVGAFDETMAVNVLGTLRTFQCFTG